MGNFDGWQTIDPPLGERGQGKVYLTRSPQRVIAIESSSDLITGSLRTSDRPLKSSRLVRFRIQKGTPNFEARTRATDNLQSPGIRRAAEGFLLDWRR
jgi:hypothetical protein